jgi:hypothetical protein
MPGAARPDNGDAMGNLDYFVEVQEINTRHTRFHQPTGDGEYLFSPYIDATCRLVEMGFFGDAPSTATRAFCWFRRQGLHALLRVRDRMPETGDGRSRFPVACARSGSRPGSSRSQGQSQIEAHGLRVTNPSLRSSGP